MIGLLQSFMIKSNLYLFIALLFFSCVRITDNYPKDDTISNNKGIPKDSLTFYYPILIRTDSEIIKTGIDTFKLNWYSSALYCANEPILYNYYQGHDIYRFLWLRAFHRPVIFSLNKEGDKVWLTTKELNKQPSFGDVIIPKKVKFSPPKILLNEVDTAVFNNNEELPIDLVAEDDGEAELVFNQTKQLTLKEWTDFESRLKTCSFWTMTPWEERSGLDGSRWIIEGHLKNKYWFVDRWSPKDNFRKAGEYLISKSGLTEEIY